MLKLTYFSNYCATGEADWISKSTPIPNGVEAPVLNTDFDSFNLSRSFLYLLLYCSQDFSQETKLPKVYLLPPGRTH